MKGLTDQAAAELSQKGLTRIGSLLQGVSGSLASGMQGFVHSRIHKIITGPRMANAWVQVNRAASQQLIAVLSGRGGKNGALGVNNGQVTLDIAPLEAVAKQDLVARGLTIAGKIPIVHATFALFPSRNLAKAQKRLPAHQRPEDRAADRDRCCCSASACRPPGATGGR